MFATSLQFCPDEALQLAKQRQAEFRSEFEFLNQDEAARRRFFRQFHLRRIANRWAPRLASWFL